MYPFLYRYITTRYRYRYKILPVHEMQVQGQVQVQKNVYLGTGTGTGTSTWPQPCSLHQKGILSSGTDCVAYIDAILPKGTHLPCLRMADRALLAGYPRHADSTILSCEGWNHTRLCVLTRSHKHACQMCQSYPGYFWEPHWNSMGLLEISRVTWQLCMRLCKQSALSVALSVTELSRFYFFYDLLKPQQIG